MEWVRSSDGTRIAFWREGRGPPLVLVHGTTADHTRWMPVLPGYTRDFTVLAMDRRGRGQSGDAPAYALEREFEDVAAVLRAAGPEASLIGHSFGAICALEAALRVPGLRRLILYEPPCEIEGYKLYPPGSRERFEKMLDAGDNEGTLTAFMRDVAGVSDAAIATMRAEPSWAGRITAAHTIVREMADENYSPDPARLAGLHVPTLLLAGSESPPVLAAATQLLAALLPEARIAVMQGQGHVAISTAPDVFLSETRAFLLG